MTEALSKRRLKLWIRLLRTTRLAESELREFLRVEHDSTLPRFDVMAALHRSDSELTMTELSRAAARLERQRHRRRRSTGQRRTGCPPNVRTPIGGSSRLRSPTKVAVVSPKLAADHEARVDALFAGVSTSDLDALDELLHRIDPRKGITHGHRWLT